MGLERDLEVYQRELAKALDMVKTYQELIKETKAKIANAKKATRED